MRILQFCKAKLSYGRHTKALQSVKYKSCTLYVRRAIRKPYGSHTEAIYRAIQCSALYGTVKYKSCIADQQKNPPSKPGNRKRKAGILGGQDQKNVGVNGGRCI